MKQNITVADETGSIAVTLWGSLTNQIIVDKSYRISQLSIREYCAVRSLTTTLGSKILPIANVSVPKDMMDIGIKTMTGEVQQINITSRKMCTNCHKKIDNTEVENSKFYRCTGCHMRQKTGSMQQVLTGTMVFKLESDSSHGSVKLQIFHSAIEKFLNDENISHFKNDTAVGDRIEEYILDMDQITVTFSMESQIIKSMKSNTCTGEDTEIVFP